jgi:hypothetical protein
VKISRFYILGIMQVSGDKQKENVGTKGAERVVKPAQVACSHLNSVLVRGAIYTSVQLTSASRPCTLIPRMPCFLYDNLDSKDMMSAS